MSCDSEAGRDQACHAKRCISVLPLVGILSVRRELTSCDILIRIKCMVAEQPDDSGK